MLWCEWPTSWFLLEYSLGMRWKCILEAEVEEGIVGGEEGVRCWGAGGQELGGPGWRTMEEWRSLGAEVLVAPTGWLLLDFSLGTRWEWKVGPRFVGCS